MAFIYAPSQLANRAELYHQLAQMTAAGIDMLRALNELERNPPARSDRARLLMVIQQINSGATFTEALRSCVGWLPEFDLSLIESGERSGRLDSSFLLLSSYYSDRAGLLRNLISELTYPVFLLHFAVFLKPFPALFMGGSLADFLVATLSILLPIYGLCVLAIILGQSRYGEGWRAFLERVLGFIPMLGKARRQLAIARLSASLNALLNAGVDIFRSWELAAAASGSPAIRRLVARWIPEMRRTGNTPGQMMKSSTIFPYLFANEYAAGEISGRLDECVERMRNYYQQEGTRKLHAFAQWVPRLIYLAIMLYIAFHVVNFYAGYFGQVGRILGE